MLEAEVSNFDVAGAVSGAIMVDNLDGGVIVFIKGSRRVLFVAEFQKDEPEIFDQFAAGAAGDKFGFGRTLCHDGLRFRAVGDGATREHTCVACSGVTSVFVVCMRGVNVGDKLVGVYGNGDRRSTGGLLSNLNIVSL